MQQPHLSQTSEKDHEGRDTDMVTPNDGERSPLAGTCREGHRIEAALHLRDAEGDAVVRLGTNQGTEPPSRVTAPLNPLLTIANSQLTFALPW